MAFAKHATLVIGLGNPGSNYARTRHNAGVWVIEELCKRGGTRLSLIKSTQSLVGTLQGDLNGVICAFPQTFMNESGRAIRPLGKRFSVTLPSALIVVHDELDLPPGVIRVKSGGGLAGHNGLRSIAQHLGTQDFTRVRVGIGKPNGGSDAVLKWVLSGPKPHEREALESSTQDAADAVLRIWTDGVDVAMNEFNTRK